MNSVKPRLVPIQSGKLNDTEKLTVSRRLVLTAIICISAAPAVAQGTKADYDRARSLGRLTRDKVTRAKVEPNWLGDNKRFWYRNDLGGGASEFVLVDAAAGRRDVAFDHTALARALSQAA